MRLLDGKSTANTIKEEIKEKVSEMKSRGERVPHLAAVLVGNDGASLTYVGQQGAFLRICRIRIYFNSTGRRYHRASAFGQIDAIK